MSHTSTRETSSDIVIRVAGDADAVAIARVAGRDTNGIPAHPVLVAEAGGQIRAATSLRDGTTVADPFYRTSELVAMLRIRAEAVREPAALRGGVARRHARSKRVAMRGFA